MALKKGWFLLALITIKKYNFGCYIKFRASLYCILIVISIKTVIPTFQNFVLSSFFQCVQPVLNPR